MRCLLLEVLKRVRRVWPDRIAGDTGVLDALKSGGI